MKNILSRLIKFLAYSAATVMILLAIAVGLFRLFLPRVPEYQEQIKSRVSAAVGMQVEFSGMDARWGLSGPELEFYNAEVFRADSGTRIVMAEEVRAGVGLMRLLFEQAVVVDRLVIRNTSIDVQQIENGRYRIQGVDVDELLQLADSGSGALTDIEIVAEDVELRFTQSERRTPYLFEIPLLRVSIDKNRVAADADVRLPGELGKQLRLSATQVLAAGSVERAWDVRLDVENLNLSGLSGLLRSERQFLSGTGDLELAMALTDGGVRNATAELDFTDISLASDDLFGIRGRVEVNVSEHGWLVAANELVVSLQDHVWPEATLRAEASVDGDGQIVALDTQASYLNLDDFSLVKPWLTAVQETTWNDFRPTGVVRNLLATVSDFGAPSPKFNVSAELDSVGITATMKRPGIRGFSGKLRANQSGGSVEIRSNDLQIQVPEYLPEFVAIDSAKGTIIWRSSSDYTTVLSDSIEISSEVFTSHSNVQIILYKDGSSPVIDLASDWSISDLARAKHYIPKKGLNSKLYDWFQMALVGGSIARGSASLNGPLEKFPFDGGEGRLLIEASVRDMTFKYHPKWPATEHSDMEVILDNARLYTTQNRFVSAGISVLDANIDIPDLRDPVLHMESFSESSLATIRAFSMRSPIAKVFGGKLDRVAVSGDASFTLSLTVPLKKARLQEYEFVARVRSDNGALAIDGFDPPISDLVGEVSIGRTEIESEGLQARFLGEQVSISLSRSEDPNVSVVATVLGKATAQGIVNDLGAPIGGLINGAAQYQARILFPSNSKDMNQPLSVEVESDLVGLGVDLPDPVSKLANTALQLRGSIRFMPGGQVIQSSGFAQDRVAWQLAFHRPEESWDFDRGVVSLGSKNTGLAETRGLHIRGIADVVRLQDWLSLSRSGEKKIGAAGRIRSINLDIGDLYLIGQHLKDHHVRVDRSARDWLVQIDGDDIVGAAFVPYDFGGARAMVLDMDKLHLPGDELDKGVATNLDPRNFPPIRLTAVDFALGDRHLGAVEVSLEKTANGLQAVSISSTAKTFEISGSGRWLADTQDPLGSHSFVTATLTSTDVEQTMSKLNYQPGIVSNDMSMSFDLDWSGGPRADFYDVLNGQMQVRFGHGQLEEVEPGAGRMFGLMSIVALPRRLSLDFRDVFSKGFGFDKIAGSFKINNGKTYTCDLSLEGPAADIGIVGEADLNSRTYDQTAIVSANVGNTLPIVGAVVAGPQVAAALLIFSQIFKKPLQEVGQVYYAISGSWDDPTVESSDSAGFVDSGDLANCLATGS